MKKYVVFMIALVAINTLSFTQTVDGLTITAVGGATVIIFPDDCTGSDVSDPIACEQKAGSAATCKGGEYKKVLAEQDIWDELGKPKNECMGSGCDNVKNNPSPTAYSGRCNKIDKSAIDPPIVDPPVSVIAP